jgi:hypothetical protein
LPVRFRRGWREAGKAWGVLRHGRGLLVLPVGAAVITGVAFGVVFLLLDRWFESMATQAAAAALVTLYPFTLAGTFVNVSYIAALDLRLRGQDASIRDGLGVAWRKRGAIVRWALLASGVGALLQALQQLRSEWVVAPLVSWLAGAAWGVLTMFFLPVLAFEDVGVRDGVRRASGLVRKHWGEGVAGTTNIALVFIVLFVPVSLLLGVAMAFAAAEGIPVEITFAAFFCLVALSSIAFSLAYQALGLALYRYATGQGGLADFSEDDLRAALQPKR